MKSKILFFTLLSMIMVNCTDRKRGKEPQPPKRSENPTVITKPEPVELTVQNIDPFIAWASASDLNEKEKVRSNIQRASTDRAVLQELIKRFEKVDTLDITYSLIVMGIIGELQNPASQTWLIRQANRPIPVTRKTPHGALTGSDIIEIISSKAVESLAYLKASDSDIAVLDIIAKHPSAAVRSAAIDAYLYNHEDSEDAKAMLKRVMQPNDLLLLDRVRFKKTNDSKAFNAAQDKFYRLHQEEMYEAPGKPTIKEVRKSDTIKVVKEITPPRLNKPN